eukprot:11884183-Prorocentrum_lima.AAC.1
MVAPWNVPPVALRGTYDDSVHEAEDEKDSGKGGKRRANPVAAMVCCTHRGKKDLAHYQAFPQY